jgi:hypothetical protein
MWSSSTLCIHQVILFSVLFCLLYLYFTVSVLFAFCQTRYWHTVAIEPVAVHVGQFRGRITVDLRSTEVGWMCWFAQCFNFARNTAGDFSSPLA